LAAFGVFNASATACSVGGRDEIFDEIDQLNIKTRGGASHVLGALPRPALSAFTRVHSPSKTGVNALNDALWRGEGWGEGQLAAPLTQMRWRVDFCALSPLTQGEGTCRDDAHEMKFK
jgi:hypothetical protein